MTEKTCEKCRFFMGVEDDDHEVHGAGLAVGECRVGPPHMDRDGAGAFPLMLITDWCGRWRGVE